ncbi:Spondin [Rubripirellula tenax]|uniref:Spondin n=1 Tax=Rubripirellula tenax TaxID=2528015 RepID=A0A5C6FCX6_9BACT|nr:spondin domain-containing protein [Rubripirellula tenax]TWU59318.1 Spondin [Rubripirellula tenax]
MLVSRFSGLMAGLTLLCVPAIPSTANAAIVDLTVTIENLAPTNSVSFAPTRVAFHNGSFDPFNNGETAGEAIKSIAEGGSGNAWFPAVTAADPNAATGTIAAGGPAVPSGNAGGLSNTATATFRIDTNSQGFFTFANMVVPSNDLFLGNDSPLGLFDSNGALTTTSILQTGSSIWDANSEVAIAGNAAFLQGSMNDLRVEEGGVVAFDFAELATYNGLTTAAGYVFDSSSITAGTEIFRVSFSSVTAVPEPSSVLAGVVCCVGLGVRSYRKRRQTAKL